MTMDPGKLQRLVELVGRFTRDIEWLDLGGHAVGEALLGMAVDQMVTEQRTLADVTTITRACWDRARHARIMQGESAPPEATAVNRTEHTLVVGARVTGAGDARVVGVTWCAACERVNGHDELGVCQRCTGPLAVLRVPLADVVRVLEQQNLVVAGPASELTLDQLTFLILLLGQLACPLAPANFVMGVGIGNLIRQGLPRQDILDCAEETIETTVAGLSNAPPEQRTMLS